MEMTETVTTLERRIPLGAAMEPYRNMEGGLGVVAYNFVRDRITVRLHNGQVLCFTYQSAGRAYVEHMKLLARAGDGLNRFIFKEGRGKEERVVAP
jgi:hypothetical protein